jgi:protein SCO1/2
MTLAKGFPMPSPTRIVLLSLMLIVVVVAGCSKKESQKQPVVKKFPVIGRVVAIQLDENKVTLAHEAIPNYMKAMTMPFNVKNSSLLAGLQVGDSVMATLVVVPSGSYLESIKITNTGKGPATVL